MKEEQQHPSFEQVLTGQFIQDIIILEDINVKPYMNIEYHSQYFFIGLCRNGHVIGQYDYRDVEFSAGEICWLVPDHVLSHSHVSPYFSVLSVFISRSYLKQLKESGALGKSHYLIELTTLKPSPEMFDTMYNAFRLLGTLIGIGIEKNKRDALITSLIRIISTVCDDYIQKNIPEIAQRNTKYDELFERFYDAIVEHYRESREVSFYAQLLCLSPKYFASLIKRTTGIPAIEWINRYVIIESKRMLLLYRHKNIQQIANELGFSELSSFSRLFKHIEGITPSAFRQNN